MGIMFLLQYPEIMLSFCKYITLLSCVVIVIYYNPKTLLMNTVSNISFHFLTSIPTHTDQKHKYIRCRVLQIFCWIFCWNVFCFSLVFIFNIMFVFWVYFTSWVIYDLQIWLKNSSKSLFAKCPYHH